MFDENLIIKFKENKQSIDEINNENSGVDVKKVNLEEKVAYFKKSFGDADLKIKLLEKDLNEYKTNKELKQSRKNILNLRLIIWKMLMFCGRQMCISCRNGRGRWI